MLLELVSTSARSPMRSGAAAFALASLLVVSVLMLATASWSVPHRSSSLVRVEIDPRSLSWTEPGVLACELPYPELPRDWPAHSGKAVGVAAEVKAVILNGTTQARLAKPPSVSAPLSPAGFHVLRRPDGRMSLAIGLLSDVTNVESLEIRWTICNVVSRPVLSDTSRRIVGSFGITGLLVAGVCLVMHRHRSLDALLLSLAGALWGTLASVVALCAFDRSGGIYCQSALLICLRLVLAALVLLAIASAWTGRSSGVRAVSVITPSFPIAIWAVVSGLLVCSLAAGWMAPTPVWHPWSVSGTMSQLACGRLPLSDSGDWYVGASAAVEGQPLTWGARRPLHSLGRGGALVLVGGHYQASLLLQVLVGAMAITSLAVAVRAALSVGCALVVTVGAVSLMATFSMSYLSESLGFSCACLWLAWALPGQCRPNFPSRLAGTLWLGLAWLVRPGPFGLLAVPFFAELAVGGPRQARRQLTTAGMLLATMMIGRCSFFLVASEVAVPNANAAPTVLGLANGLGWQEAQARFLSGDPSREHLPLPDQASLMYRLAARDFLDHPGKAAAALLKGFWNGVRTVIFKSVEGLWARPLLGDSCRFLEWIPEAAMLVMAVLSCITLARTRCRPGLQLLAWAWIGLLASLPVIWKDGQERGVTLAMPAVIIGLSLGFVRIGPDLAEEDRTGERHGGFRLIAGLMIMVMLATGAVVTALRKDETGCDLPWTIAVAKAPSVFMVEGPSVSSPWGSPAISRQDAMDAMVALGWSEQDLVHAISAVKLPCLLVEHYRCEAPTRIILVEGAAPGSSDRLVIEELAPHGNPYLLRATRWRWSDSP